MTTAKTTFSMRFSPEELKRIRETAEDEGVSVSEFIRRAVDMAAERRPCPTCNGAGVVARKGKRK